MDTPLELGADLAGLVDPGERAVVANLLFHETTDEARHWLGVRNLAIVEMAQSMTATAIGVHLGLTRTAVSKVLVVVGLDATVVSRVGSSRHVSTGGS